jgi:hypothetical protein
MSLATLTLLATGVVNASPVAPGFPQPFDVGARYSREIHVSAAAPPGGDGRAAAPLRTIAAALAKAEPGTRVVVAAGTYGAVGSVRNLQGTAVAPIALVGRGEVVIDPRGQGSALHLAEPRYVVIEGIAIRNAVPHGMNIDDGGSYDSPGSYVVLRTCRSSASATAATTTASSSRAWITSTLSAAASPVATRARASTWSVATTA